MTPYAIDQRLILETGEIQNYLVVRFSSGKETRAPIDLATTKEILRDSGPSTPPKPVDMEPKVAAPAPDPTPPPPQAPQDEMVRWQALGDDILHPLMKEALRRMGVAQVVPLSMLESLVDQINERFSQEDWQELANSPGVAQPATPPAAPAPPPPPPQPPIGAIQWADGRPVVPSATRPGRTVQKDEMGYPLPQDGEVDPGELVGGADLDEDGVGQL